MNLRNIFTPLISMMAGGTQMETLSITFGEAGIWLLPVCLRSISEPSVARSVLPNWTNKTFRLLVGGRR